MTKRALTGKAVLAGKGAGKAPGGRAVADARLLALEGEAETRSGRAEAGKAKTELGTIVIKYLFSINKRTAINACKLSTYSVGGQLLYSARDQRLTIVP